jgi:alpha-D-ribose 1-methylphosphonate 5-triphosphate synthase subunit PhnH
MRLDPVHDLQRVFRKILAATASPGGIVELAREAELLDLELPINKGVLLVALALLDAETSFFAASANSAYQAGAASPSEAISHLTYAKAAYPDEADFVFVLGREGAAEAIAAAKAGTLVDPHLGATLIVEVDSLDEGGGLELTGPGIESSARLGVLPSPDWTAAREAKNAEFPLGVDLILVDSKYRLTSLPRTTRIRKEA